MLPIDNERNIAQFEVEELQKLFNSIKKDDENGDNFLELLDGIEEFCVAKRDKWKQLITTVEPVGGCSCCCSRLAQCMSGFNSTIFWLYNGQFAATELDWKKIMSIYSVLVDCIGSYWSIDPRDFQNLFRHLTGFWTNVSSDEPAINGELLEARYFILDILLTKLLPRVRQNIWTPDSMIDGEAGYTLLEPLSAVEIYLDPITTLLLQAIRSGSTKIAAKICSWLFQDIIRRLKVDQDILANSIFSTLSSAPKEDEEHSAIETRCVGIYSLVNTIQILMAGGVRNKDSMTTILNGNGTLIALIRGYLISDKIFVRKCGRALLGLVLGESAKSNEAWSNFLTFMETLEMKQLHVLKPAFPLLDSLIQYCLTNRASGSCSTTVVPQYDISWLRLAFYNCLHHQNSFVVKWAIVKYFQTDPVQAPTIVGEKNCEFLFDVVLPVLNKSDAYYRVSEENALNSLLETMERFFRGTISAWTSGTFWQNWLRLLKGYSWAPVPLFYISHVSSVISHDHEGVGVFEDADLDALRSVFSEFRTIPVLFIRAAVQEANLKIVLNLYDWNESIMLKACTKVFASVPPKLIRPERARRYRGRAENLSWLTVTDFARTLHSAVGSISDQFYENGNSTSDILWTAESLRAFIIISTMAVPSVDLCPRLVVGLISQQQDYHQADIRDFVSHLLLLTPLLETGKNYPSALADDISTSAKRDIDAVVWYSCQHDITKRESDVFVEFICVVQPWLNDSTEKHLNQMHKAYCDIGIGSIRRYYILRIFVLFLEWSALRGHVIILNGNVAMDEFILRLVLEDRDRLRNVQGFEPSDWNRLLSEYAALKWRCLLIPLESTTPHHVLQDDSVWKQLAECAYDSLDSISGAEDIHWVLRCMAAILPKVSTEENALIATIIKRIHQICYEHRKCDQFVPTVEHCCVAIFRIPFMLKNSSQVLDEIQKVAQSLQTEVENPSLACCIAEALDRSLRKGADIDGLLAASPNGRRFLLSMLVELCCFGNLLRKDQRIIYDACELIKGFDGTRYEYQNLNESDHLASQKTRMHAFHCILQILNRVKDTKQELIDTLVELACNKLVELTTGATKTGYFPNSQCHRVRTRAVQLLLLIDPFINDVATARRIQQFTIQYLVEQNQQPSVRLLLEWLMIRLNQRFAEDGLLDDWWNAENYMIEKRVGTLCTWMEVLMHVGLYVPPVQRRRYVLEYVKRCLPWCTAQNFTLRCCAQTCLRRLWTDDSEEKNWEDCEEQSSEEQNSSSINYAWTLMKDILTPTIMFDKEQKNSTKNIEKASKDFYFAVFNARMDYSVETILHTFPRLCFLPVDELISFEMWDAVFFDSDCLNSIPPKNPTDELAKGSAFVWRDRTQEQLAEELRPGAAYESLQTKTNLFDGGGDILTSDILTDSKRREASKTEGLVVVATLIDRPTNLGGLCRTCEIFGASEYAVSTYRVAENFEFQVLSVSSERWVNMIEVKPVDLLDYLKRKQADGYTVIAVEQTTTSCQLNEYRFPPKSLLLLGNEKEGIQVDLLQCVDVCVEIPQIGHTRSLNVHVAGALLIWEYAKQRKFINNDQ